MVSPPLVVTVRLDRGAFRRLESERRRFFPAHRNIVPAHISLFHALPGDLESRVDDVIRRLTAETPVFALRVASLMRLGNGVAYSVESSELVRLHGRLAAELCDTLTKQDQQTYRPHVTIQNKVSREEAEMTYSSLNRYFVPFEFTAVGICLWRYLNGPWEFRQRYAFSARRSGIRAGTAAAGRNPYSGSRLA